MPWHATCMQAAAVCKRRAVLDRARAGYDTRLCASRCKQQVVCQVRKACAEAARCIARTFALRTSACSVSSSSGNCSAPNGAAGDRALPVARCSVAAGCWMLSLTACLLSSAGAAGTARDSSLHILPVSPACAQTGSSVCARTGVLLTPLDSDCLADAKPSAPFWCGAVHTSFAAQALQL